MEKLIKYLKSNKIQFSLIDTDIIEIEFKTYKFVEPIDGVIVNSDFSLNAEETTCDFYVFSLAGKFYFSPNSSKLELNPLKYIGSSRIDLFDTKSFLGVHGGFEILNGSGNYNDWCAKAKFLGVQYLGICEKNTLGGVMKFQNACDKFGIIPVIGETVTVKRLNPEFIYDVKCYVKDDKGWENLLLINKEINVVNHKYVSEEVFLRHLEGLFIVLDPKTLPFGNAFPYDLKSDYFYSFDTVEFDEDIIDKDYLLNLKRYYYSSFKPLPIIDAYYLDKEDYEVKRLLNKIANKFEHKSKNQYFKDWDDYLGEISLILKDNDKFIDLVSELKKNEDIFLSHIKFRIATGKRHLPKYEMTPEESSMYTSNEELFWGLISNGLAKIEGKNLDIYIERVEKEVSVIEFGGVVDYFLTLHDIVNWCKKNDIIVGVGRGSAGGSLVSMLIGLIHLDPLEFDLLFERFLNEGRVSKSLPDIDTDVEANRRQEVKEYMEKRFGTEHVVSVGTYTALQLKASLKDLGRVFNIPFDTVNYITSIIEDANTFQELIKIAVKDKRVKSFINQYPELVNTIPLIIGQPKAKSVHACAMVIYPKDKNMYTWAPVCKQDDLFVTEWEGSEMEQVGFLKEDILGVRQLDKFKNINNLIVSRGGSPVNIYDIPYDDEEVINYFKKGYNGDCFHFGSRGLTKYCKELQPDNIDDLVAGISLYRPGAIENNFHNEYVWRKDGKHEVEYFEGSEEILNKTYGVFVYQEQIMKLCQVLGGLSLVEADDVRKAMVKKKYEELTKYKGRFLDYYITNFGVSQDYAEHVWDQIDKASTYLFNKSHAAAYAITGYISQWFKVHYPVEYWTTAFEFMTPDDVKVGKVSDYISEIMKTGKINIKAIDINHSGRKMSSKGNTIYWSITSVKGLGDVASKFIEEDKAVNGSYFDFEEFYSRISVKGSKVNKSHIVNLIICGAFDEIENIDYPAKRLELIEKLSRFSDFKNYDLGKIYPENKDLIYEDWWWGLKQRELCGISEFNFEHLCATHLMDKYVFLRSELVSEIEDSDKTYYSIGGVIIDYRKRETKNGEFVTLFLDSNSVKVQVNIFPNHYNSIKSSGLIIDDSCVGNIVCVSGMVKFDDYLKDNVLKVWDNSEIIILK